MKKFIALALAALTVLSLFAGCAKADPNEIILPYQNVAETPENRQAAMVETAKYGFENFLYLVAVISLNLGVVNLLPLPALDGGRLVFVLIEMIFRKPVPKEIEAKIHTVGLFLFFGLFILITVLDVKNLFG